ncbi:CoxG family protein [Muricoccus radiodurans]|uniref:CoxG family protein n=1 Tax=Muricoccus radiodurans TaxID=2231721 RepID=UPI003CEB1614
MDMTGSRRIEAPRTRVWDALNDPEVLRLSIPGCESVERTGPDSFQARVAVRIGPMSAKFGGKVTLTNIRPPEGYTITGEGQGGAMGFAGGGADVSLVEEGPTTTTLNYDVKAQVGGKMAQLGARLVDSTARQMADQFFDRFAAHVAAPVAPVATTTDTVITTGTDTMATTRVSDAPATSTTQSGIVVGPAAPNRPTGAPSRTASVNLFSLIPREPYGLPINFWIGAALMVVVLGLLFVIG